MNINDRVRDVRNALDLTQKDFGQRLAIAQSYLTNIETGKREVTEKIQKLICLQFNVNEDWLRTGKGEMFVEDDNVLISQLAKQYNLDSFSRKFIETYIGLPESHREVIKGFVQALTSPEPESVNVDDAIKIYRAARSETNTEHEVIDDSQGKIDRLKHLHKVRNSDEL